MSDEIRVISADKDGADLRREKKKASRYVRCDGTADDVEINEAIQGLGNKTWKLPPGAWERIFGRKG